MPDYGDPPWDLDKRGRPRIDAYIKKLARDCSPRVMERLMEWVESGHPTASIAACRAILDRAWGKPAIAVEISSPSQEGTLAAIDRPPRETREEWIRRRIFELQSPAGALDLPPTIIDGEIVVK